MKKREASSQGAQLCLLRRAIYFFVPWFISIVATFAAGTVHAFSTDDAVDSNLPQNYQTEVTKTIQFVSYVSTLPNGDERIYATEVINQGLLNGKTESVFLDALSKVSIPELDGTISIRIRETKLRGPIGPLLLNVAALSGGPLTRDCLCHWIKELRADEEQAHSDPHAAALLVDAEQVIAVLMRLDPVAGFASAMHLVVENGGMKKSMYNNIDLESWHASYSAEDLVGLKTNAPVTLEIPNKGGAFEILFSLDPNCNGFNHVTYLLNAFKDNWKPTSEECALIRQGIDTLLTNAPIVFEPDWYYGPRNFTTAEFLQNLNEYPRETPIRALISGLEELLLKTEMLGDSADVTIEGKNWESYSFVGKNLPVAPIDPMEQAYLIKSLRKELELDHVGTEYPTLAKTNLEADVFESLETPLKKSFSASMNESEATATSQFVVYHALEDRAALLYSFARANRFYGKDPRGLSFEKLDEDFETISALHDPKDQHVVRSRVVNHLPETHYPDLDQIVSARVLSREYCWSSATFRERTDVRTVSGKQAKIEAIGPIPIAYRGLLQKHPRVLDYVGVSLSQRLLNAIHSGTHGVYDPIDFARVRPFDSLPLLSEYGPRLDVPWAVINKSVFQYEWNKGDNALVRDRSSLYAAIGFAPDEPPIPDVPGLAHQRPPALESTPTFGNADSGFAPSEDLPSGLLRNEDFDRVKQVLTGQFSQYLSAEATDVAVRMVRDAVYNQPKEVEAPTDLISWLGNFGKKRKVPNRGRDRALYQLNGQLNQLAATIAQKSCWSLCNVQPEEIRSIKPLRTIVNENALEYLSWYKIDTTKGDARYAVVGGKIPANNTDLRAALISDPMLLRKNPLDVAEFTVGGRKNVADAVLRSRALTDAGQGIIGDIAYHGVDMSMISSAPSIRTNGIPNGRSLAVEAFFLNDVLKKVFYKQDPISSRVSLTLEKYLQDQAAAEAQAIEVGRVKGAEEAGKVKTEPPKSGWTVFLGITSTSDATFSMGPIINITFDSGFGFTVAPAPNGLRINPGIETSSYGMFDIRSVSIPSTANK